MPRPPKAQQAMVYGFAVLAVALALAPFAWMIISSVASPADLLTRPLHWIPGHASLSRYRAVASGGNDAAQTFAAAFINSLVVAAVSVAIALAAGIFGAYAFARLRFRFRRSVMVLFLLTYMLPPISILIPLYLIEARLQLLDTRAGLVLVYVSFITPFVLWVMGNYFQSIPEDLEDAGRIDGLSRVGVLFRIVLPLSVPGLLSTALLGFLLAWDEFLYALIFTDTDASKTIPVAIAEFTGRHAVDFGMIATGGVLASIPPVIIALLFQRYIVGGLTAGALKG
jgi:multiple sugar transport system permease protein